MPGLDGVRGVAILMVMAIHFVGDSAAYTTAQRLVVKTASFGLLGVDLFFVLSGLLITGLLLDAKSRPHYFRNFYARRTLRIFPLYYVVLAVLLLVLPRVMVVPAGLQQARAHQAWLWTYTGNFYTAAKSSWSALTYMSHFWSLAIEEHFYLLWPMVVFVLRREALERACVGVIVVGLALRIALALGGMSELSISVLTPCRVDTLCVGGLVAAVARRPGGAEMLAARCGRAAGVLAGILVALSAWCATAKLGLPVLHQLRNTLYAFFFGAFSLLSVRPVPGVVGRLLRSRLLTFFGKYSYGLYVYHGVLNWHLGTVGFESRLDAALGDHAIAMVAHATIGVGASTAVAVLSYHLLEKRFLALKRHFEGAAAPAERS
jgi:peptidoglycan/LPS O-acetylase OafA/YrhL